MLKKHSIILYILIFLAVSSISFPQAEANYLKPYPAPKKAEYFYSEDRSESAKKVYSEVAGIEKGAKAYREIDRNSDLFKKKFINYTSKSGNYFRIDDDANSLWNGKHWNYLDFPLKIYIKKPHSKYFKNKFTNYVYYAFQVWQAADERIKCKYVKSSEEADIIIAFEENLMEKYNENYLGLTDYELDSNNKIIRSRIEIGLLKFDNKRISDGEIKSTIIHEVGHSLGLGHSKNYSDLMYPYISEDSSDLLNYIELSTGDMEALSSALNLGNRDFSSDE